MVQAVVHIRVAVNHDRRIGRVDDDGDRTTIPGRVVGAAGAVGGHAVGGGVDLVCRATAVAVGRVGQRGRAGAQTTNPGHRARAAAVAGGVVGERASADRGRRGRGRVDDDG